MNLKKIKRIQDSETDYSSWKVEAFGESEVRELFDYIQRDGNNLDKQFVKNINNVFPDMPMAVKILRGGDADEDSDEFFDEYDNLFTDDTPYYYCKVGDPNNNGICESDELWDFLGDGTNPSEVYVATYSRSDGMENTVILYYGKGWYYVCRWDIEKIHEALMENILNVENGGEVLNECYQKEFDKPIIFSNKSLF